MTNKSTQYYKLYQLLKGSVSCTKETIAKELGGIDITSVPVYIHALKHKFKAEIETIKEGRKVVAYKLVNKDTLSVPKFRSNAVSGIVRTQKAAKSLTDGSVAILDPDLDVTEVSDREMADIHDSLSGLAESRGHSDSY